MKNPYAPYALNMGPESFLYTVLVLLKAKVSELKVINNRYHLNKQRMSLPDLKTKYEMTHDVLEALGIISHGFEDVQYVLVYTTIGTLISEGNFDYDSTKFVEALSIIEKMLESYKTPASEDVISID